MIRPEEIRVKKSREYFKRLATIDERAKKKKEKRKLDPEYKRGKKSYVGVAEHLGSSTS